MKDLRQMMVSLINVPVTMARFWLQLFGVVGPSVRFDQDGERGHHCDECRCAGAKGRGEGD